MRSKVEDFLINQSKNLPKDLNFRKSKLLPMGLWKAEHVYVVVCDSSGVRGSHLAKRAIDELLTLCPERNGIETEMWTVLDIGIPQPLPTYQIRYGQQRLAMAHRKARRFSPFEPTVECEQCRA